MPKREPFSPAANLSSARLAAKRAAASFKVNTARKHLSAFSICAKQASNNLVAVSSPLSSNRRASEIVKRLASIL